MIRRWKNGVITMVKVKKHRQNNFTILDNTPLHDTELSLKAKGLFAYLWSQSDEWNFYETEVVKHSKDGISSLRSGIHELEERGYLQRKRTRVNGKVKDSVWILSETPNLDFLSLENLNLENRTLISTNNNNTNLNKDNSSIEKKSKQLEEDFEKLWKLYPKKSGKPKAFSAYKRAIKKGVTNKEIQTGIIKYLTQIKVQGTTKEYIKNGSTWFNQECWNDEYNLGQEKSPVNPKTVPSSAPANRTMADLEREQRESRRDAFPIQYKEHPEWFNEETIKSILEEFPELREKVAEIDRARATSDRNTA